MYSIGRRREPRYLDVDIDDEPDLRQFLSDRPVYWLGYDAVVKPIRFNPNRLLLERQQLSRFSWVMSHTVLADEVDSSTLFASVRAVSEQIQHWISNLPAGVSYAKEMPSPLFEFQLVTLHVPSASGKGLLTSVIA